jgi:ethanolamine utilization protein EutJ
MKLDPSEQVRLFPIIRPVMEKVASIVARHVAINRSQNGVQVKQLVLVGGTSIFPGIAAVVEEYTGLPTFVPERPLFVTPLGIAMHDIDPETMN